MLRTYIICILAAGFLASFLSVEGGPAADAQVNEDRGTILVSAEEQSTDDGFDSVGSGDGVDLRRSSDGHFYADVTVNGAPVRFLVDTGASGIALSRDDARRVGLAISSRMDQVVGRGASGDVRGEVVQLDRVELGGHSAENIPAVVLDGGPQSLLGQSFLSEFDSVQIKGDKMLLR